MDRERFQRVADLFHEARSRDPAECSRFLYEACDDDAELRAAVERMLAADRALEPSACEPSLPTVRQGPHATGLPTRIGHYRIRRLIDEGGMGRVYLAEQEQPRRAVALKVMRPGIASRTALRRFEFESQMLARLRHPNIAQVYEAGTHDMPQPDGAPCPVPFFAMEYVRDALPITEYAVRQELPPRARLALMLDVCDAVHHAHQKGIIHRDLKPTNILVDSSGKPKIIDFGVARSMDAEMLRATLQTDLGQLIGTLQYMSPEQCAAIPEDIDTATDVYSLGVVLYELMSGSLPYDVSSAPLHEAARIVREEPPARPSTIHRLLRGDIETITLKALEKERTRRYRSAAELADDIHRYLDVLPISARPPSATYRLRKFARRNKAGVAIGGLVVAVAIALVGASALAGVEQRRADAARAELDRHAALLRDTWRELHAVYKKLEPDDGTLAAREMLARGMASFLSELPGEATTDRQWRLDLATAYTDLGDILGGSRSQNLGDAEGAIESYAKARALLEPLLEAHEDDAELQRKLADVLTRLADLTRRTDHRGALELRRLILNIEERWPSQDEREHRRRVVRSRTALADALRRDGDREAALSHYEAIASMLAGIEGLDVDERRDLAITHGRIGHILSGRGEHAAALEHLRANVRIREELAAVSEKSRYHRDLAVALRALGEGLLHADAVAADEALPHVLRAEAIMGQLIQEAPLEEARNRQTLALIQLLRGEVQASAGHVEEALLAYGSAEIGLRSLLAEHPNDADREYIGAVIHARGDLLHQLGRTADANRVWREALEIFGSLAKADPANPHYAATVAELRTKLKIP